MVKSADVAVLGCMNVYQFMSESPFLTFFLAVIACYFVKIILAFCINRPLRHANIRKHGYPPEHCDADGDFRSDDES